MLSSKNDTSHLRGLLYIVLFGLFTVHIFGTLAYQVLTHGQHHWFDSFYMTFITVSTIGFSEVFDMSNNPAARALTVLLGIFGAGTLSMMFSIMTVLFLESDINETLQRKRMDQAVKKLKNHYILCGLGRVGENVAQELSITKRPFVSIDPNPQAIQNLKDKNPGFLYVLGDATDDDCLKHAGIDHAVGLFAVSGEDALNMMIIITARQLRPDLRIVARCHDVKNIEKMKKAGADSIVSPDFTGGMRIASAMVRPHVVSFIEEMLRDEASFRVEEIEIPSSRTGESLGNIAQRHENYILMGVRRQNGQLIFNPSSSWIIEQGSILIAMANTEGRQNLIDQLS
ncbi:potassium channel family protein [Orrella sp. NBD-18]|uniref:Potassium channel family protein n=1 Tax=Sheuella amnicola TaxID=2707330 RepID=A0A6B2QVJ9_9BURK|nr:potassium channel family protein [Sheuella amnicola]NDY81933.1 potassium channel family protein [Sheuella amnicola]HBI83652.1 potassium transporter TrkA [Alcaligenaceae bacterium]